MEFKIHEVDWTDEKVERFWTFQNRYDAFEETWFTRQVGKGIINFFRNKTEIKGTLLDYGTGKGHLVAHLLDLDPVTVYGFDFSPESKSNVDSKYKDRTNYKGTVLIRGGAEFSSFQSNFFDVVFLIEAIEHLTDKYLFPTFEEIHRILKPGGRIIVTTPNSENLSAQHVLCPDCGALYHRVQHVRGFNEADLCDLMERQKFRKVASGATNFAYYNEEHSLRNILRRTLSKYRINTVQPHLWYIGKKQ